MRFTVLWLSLLSAFVAALSIAANGENASTVSKMTSAKLDGRTIICNMVQNSHCQEAIKSLQAILVTMLEKKFEELTAALNKTAFHGTVRYLLRIPVFFYDIQFILGFFSLDRSDVYLL